MSLNLLDFGADPTGVNDCKSAFDSAVLAIKASNATRTLIVNPGTYRFATAPNFIDTAINLVGEGKACSKFIKDYSANGYYFINRVQNTVDTYGGGAIKDLTILAGPNCHDGIAVCVTATPDPNGLNSETQNPHGILLDNLMLGAFPGGGTFGFGIYLDGSRNTGHGALGIRSVNIRATSVNSCSTADYYLNQSVGGCFVGVEAFGTPAYPFAVDGKSVGNIVISRTCIPTIVDSGSIDTYKWP